MELGLRFDPPITFKRLLARRQIDEEGVVYVDAFDQIGSAPQAPVNNQIEPHRRQRDPAPSPETAQKPTHEVQKNPVVPVPPKLPEAAIPIPVKVSETMSSIPPRRQGPVVEASSRMPGFQPINAAQTANHAPRGEGVASTVSIRHPRRASRGRLSTADETADVPELATRDWTLVRIVGKKTRHGVFLYKARWEPTILDISYIQLIDDAQLVKYRGAYWEVESLEDPALNEDTSVLEAKVSWNDTWHPLWEFTSALESVIDWEVAHDPQKDSLEKKHYWWRYSALLRAHRDPQTDFDPALYRDIDGEEINPELHGDYTFALMERLMSELASGEVGPVPHSTIIDLLNQPLRQRLIFSPAFVESGKSYKLHRNEFVRAAIVCVVGHAREDRCNVCTDFSSKVPFSDCLTFGKTFEGCCANSVVIFKRQICNLHLDARTFRDFGLPATQDDDTTRDDDADPTASSSPLPGHERAARSSVEPEVSPSRTPPTSQSGQGGHAGGASPELESDRLIDADLQGSPRTPITRRSARPIQQGASPPQSPTNASLASNASPKSQRSRKRKSSFDDDEKPASPRSRRSISDAPREDSPSTTTEPDSKLPNTSKTDSDEEDKSSFAHPGCPKNGGPCIHPTYGTPEPLPQNFPGIVYRDHEFERDGEATEDQVRFVISRMYCYHTELLHHAWERMLHPSKKARRRSKYRFLVNSAEFLNGFVQDYCPEFVDLTMEE